MSTAPSSSDDLDPADLALAAHLASGAALPGSEPDRLAIEALFDRTFAHLDTTLRGGFDEPLYMPGPPAVIRYAHDHVASALHEVAHWLVAGPQRRELVDFGYWYAPDGRSPEQQAQFELVEVKPQAMEWVLAEACGLGFRLSADNLQGDARPSLAFARSVVAQRRRYGAHLPARAARLTAAMRRTFGR